jgi:hypothetical protein
MNAKKKRLGTKAQVKKERKRRIAVVIFSVFVLVIVALSSYFAYNFLNQSAVQTFIEPTLQFKPENPNLELKAAIVDHLSLTNPNQTFIETAAKTLTSAGYTVDYYSGEKVTVEFYRNLPSHEYKLIIFRVHTTEKGAFFTSQPYSTTSYIQEQWNDQIWKVSYYGDPPFYFGISPSFVKSCINGKFEETILIAMGCYSLKFNDMAEAFIEKGAKVYIGWTGSVLGSHTDLATTRLLKHLLLERETIRKSLVNTINEVGPDPAYKYQSVLIAFPEKALDTIIPAS